MVSLFFPAFVRCNWFAINCTYLKWSIWWVLTHIYAPVKPLPHQYNVSTTLTCFLVSLYNLSSPPSHSPSPRQPLIYYITIGQSAFSRISYNLKQTGCTLGLVFSFSLLMLRVRKVEYICSFLARDPFLHLQKASLQAPLPWSHLADRGPPAFLF